MDKLSEATAETIQIVLPAERDPRQRELTVSICADEVLLTVGEGRTEVTQLWLSTSSADALLAFLGLTRNGAPEYQRFIHMFNRAVNAEQRLQQSIPKSDT